MTECKVLAGSAMVERESAETRTRGVASRRCCGVSLIEFEFEVG